jgi:hypothetical protein
MPVDDGPLGWGLGSFPPTDAVLGTVDDGHLPVGQHDHVTHDTRHHLDDPLQRGVGDLDPPARRQRCDELPPRHNGIGDGRRATSSQHLRLSGVGLQGEQHR